jgi:hypothetical protein
MVAGRVLPLLNSMSRRVVTGGKMVFWLRVSQVVPALSVSTL